MKTIIHLVRAGVAGMVLLLMANSPTLAQSVNGPLYADCGTSVVYYGSAPGIPNPTFSWNIAYSSGGGTSSLGPTIAVNLPNARGLATIRLTVSWEELVTTVIPNPSGMGTTTITRREPRSSSVTYYTQIGFIPSVPSILSGSGVVCGNNSTGTYSTNSVPGATTFTWEVSPPYRIVHPITGALVSTYTGTQTSVNVRFPGSGSVSNGYIRVKANSGGNCPASSGYRTRKVEFGPQTGSMTGPSTMALTTVGRFTVSGSGLSNYSWSTPSGLSPLSGTTTNSMVAEGLSATSGYVTATYRTCGVTRSSSRYVRVTGSSNGGPGFGGAARGALPTAIDIPSAGLYPNPATAGVVTLTSGHPLEQVAVVNLMGQVVKRLEAVSGHTATLDVDDLKAGTYFVISLDSEGKHSYPLVVE